MKHRGRLFLATSIVCMLVNLILSGVNAEIFDIGQRVENDTADYQFYSFSSKTYMRNDEHELNLTTLIFDGNLSTGIDHNISDNQLNFRLEFVFPLYVNNITFLPSFGNGTSNYSFSILIHSSSTVFLNDVIGETSMRINGYISGVILKIFPNGTDRFYFNDVIIDYTPFSPDLTGFQNQIDNLNSQITLLVDELNEMNTTINTLDQIQLQVLENMTSIQEGLNTINQDIDTLYNSMDRLTSNVTELNQLQELVGQLEQDTLSLQEYISEIEGNLPSEYNDTALNTRVLQLESENAALEKDIQELTKKVESLEDEPEDFPALGAYTVGILGILIAIIALVMASRKTGAGMSHNEKKDVEEPDSPKDESDEKEYE